jgi:hypothetical protein
MGRSQVCYVAVCEVLLAVVVAVFGFVFFASKMYLAAAPIFALCLGLGGVAVGFVRRRKWAWYASWIVGALGIVFGAWIFWAAEHASVYGDGSEAGIIAVLIFILALPAIGMMLRYSLREFISVDSH